MVYAMTRLTVHYTHVDACWSNYVDLQWTVHSSTCGVTRAQGGYTVNYANYRHREGVPSVQVLANLCTECFGLYIHIFMMINDDRIGLLIAVLDSYTYRCVQ